MLCMKTGSMFTLYTISTVFKKNQQDHTDELNCVVIARVLHLKKVF